ncbi:hypothetical protein HRbin36_00393 [bacterium HR36]|nr:hypothetical protein HRbin36_00393 [bacterium HR36]
MMQLVRAGERAVPYLIQVLSDPQQKQVHDNVITVLRSMRGEAVAPLLVVLADAPSASLRMVAFHVVLEERDPRLIPYLWLAEANPNETPVLRREARRALASLLHRSVSPTESQAPLGDWRVELLREAENYYHHRQPLPPGETVRWWRWEPGKGLVAQSVSRRDYEVLAGTYWLRKILDIAPDYRPAQVLLTSFLLERAIEVSGWDKPLSATSPQLVSTLSVSGGRLLEETLGRALHERKTATAFAALQVLAEVRDARLVYSGDPSAPPLIRALSYPDPRVRWQAANTILQTPLPSAFRGSSQVVQILARAVTLRDNPRVVLALVDAIQTRQAAERFRALGYEPVTVASGRAALREVANEHTDLLVLDMRLSDFPLDYHISLLRQSPEGGYLPIVLWGTEESQSEARRLAARFPFVTLAVPFPMSEAMFQHIVQSAAVPHGPPLSQAQRQAMRQEALNWLLRIARGELPHYPMAPAYPALLAALQDDTLAPSAAAILAHVRGRLAQEALAKAMLAAQRPDAVQIAIAQAFYHHVQANTYLLGDEHLQQIRGLAQKPVPAPVRDIIVRLLQQLSPSPTATSQLLQRLPVPTAPPAKP